MINSRLMNILRAPIVTEKSERAIDKNNCFVFKVLPDATKLEIKQAVESNFNNVKVGSVRTLNVQGKKRRSVHGTGVHSDWKKAYVTLSEGEIDFSSFAGKESK